MKDNFSSQSGSYSKYRPEYPQELFDYLDSLVYGREKAWDCGTGNGQVAYRLAGRFGQVCATDISRSQLDHARQAPNILYSVQPAEHTDFEAGQFDLVTVAQAIHWFDFDRFYAEVRRTAKNKALLAVIGYGLPRLSPELDKIIAGFYEDTIGQYWDMERKYIDENYATIPFPFDEIKAPSFVHTLHWNKEHLTGYLNTWSAVKHFIRKNGFNPVDRLQDQIDSAWGKAVELPVHFHILLRIGKIQTGVSKHPLSR